MNSGDIDPKILAALLHWQQMQQGQGQVSNQDAQFMGGLPQGDLQRPALPNVQLERPALPNVQLERPPLPNTQLERPPLPQVDLQRPSLQQLMGGQQPLIGGSMPQQFMRPY